MECSSEPTMKTIAKSMMFCHHFDSVITPISVTKQARNRSQIGICTISAKKIPIANGIMTIAIGIFAIRFTRFSETPLIVTTKITIFDGNPQQKVPKRAKLLPYRPLRHSLLRTLLQRQLSWWLHRLLRWFRQVKSG